MIFASLDGLLGACVCLAVASSIQALRQVGAGVTHQVCRWKSFNASCPLDTLPMMRHALYGRMELGRCIREDFNNLGCSSDVLPYLDRQCSGRRSCSVGLPDSNLESIPRHPCPRELAAYLEISYVCQPVETAPTKHCTSSPLAVSGSQGYLSNAITESTSKGSFSCPWMIKANPGQTIRITLWDFGVWQTNWTRRSGVVGSRSNQVGICHKYGQIEEPSTGSSVTLCGGSVRDSVVYESNNGEVLVNLMDPSTASEKVYFFLQYQIIGCGDPGPVAGATVTQEGDTANVRCEHGGGEWQMRCLDGAWVLVGSRESQGAANCTGAGTSWGFSTFMQNTLSLPQGVLIALILGIAVLIAVIIFAFGVLSLRKRRQHEQAIPLPLDDSDEKYSRQSSYAKEQYPMLAKQERQLLGRESEYATTLQRHLAVHPGATSPSLSEHLFTVSPSSECCPLHSVTPYADASIHYNTARMSTFKPNEVDHVYESPKFERRNYDFEGHVTEECSTPFYHELEPDAAQRSPTFTPLHCLLYNRPQSDPC